MMLINTASKKLAVSVNELYAEDRMIIPKESEKKLSYWKLDY